MLIFIIQNDIFGSEISRKWNPSYGNGLVPKPNTIILGIIYNYFWSSFSIFDHYKYHFGSEISRNHHLESYRYLLYWFSKQLVPEHNTLGLETIWDDISNYLLVFSIHNNTFGSQIFSFWPPSIITFPWNFRTVNCFSQVYRIQITKIWWNFSCRSRQKRLEVNLCSRKDHPNIWNG